ncbi:glycoside hydrolase family 31 protein [Plantactinospora soyae]|uniref:Alpha-D-xyloside xylohydrolase n=1 Tax=Plantactinospora soyae TaxID=1544732 RepID=A0A927MEY9_9ACTN|nr:TIM-barrel domain-containing protein [Plantactinospora soyae]MBE1491871.1 alpha-D-xyloside xylohydrolase [Plantactinospora soyae]
MTVFRTDHRSIEVTTGHEVLRIESWGADSVRVRVGQHRVIPDLPGALLSPKPTDTVVTTANDRGRLVNGGLTVVVERREEEAEVEARIRFERTDTGEELLAEQRAHFWWPGARLFLSQGNGYARLEQRFEAYPGERFFGLGQHTHGRLDQKGLVLDLVQRNGEINIPFLLSSRGYGLLWNSPAVGRVELAENGTRWVADSARQIDYWVTTGSPAGIMARYADATGHAPPLPDWASGFWQSKLRYRNQAELLGVVREHLGRGLPLSVIVIDFFHWTHLGSWTFDPVEWPDPAGMVRELDELGVKVMVSIWPSVNPLSENYRELTDRGLLVGTESGVPFHAPWIDKGYGTEMPVAFYDATDPQAREFIWSRVRRNYHDLGIKVWWLDACEPEIRPGHHANLRFHAGPGAEVANLYPVEHARAFYEGMLGAGDDEVVSLCRSGWAGSQRYGAALWSGDIPATFASLRTQIRAGLNVGLSGIPWWTTDIGGFHGGDPDSPAYRELIIRWFQYGAFCPLFRLHGFRLPKKPLGPEMTGGPNEVWSYGPEAYAVIVDVLRLRERLRPYVMAQMRVAHEQGLPPMRPLFVDFTSDPVSWTVEDQFLLGPDLLVAPVTAAGERERDVYLPAGIDWLDPYTGRTHSGGQTIRAAAPLRHIPVLVRHPAAPHLATLLKP